MLKFIGFILLGIYGVIGAFKPHAFSLLNGADLLFHEAGHVFFGFFGQYIATWGGTLFQLLLPLGLAIAFGVKRKEPLSSAVMAWWFGQNFFHISPYIKDARAQALPLVGGGEHDWTYILYKHGLLMQDQALGNAVWVLGLLIVVGAAGWGAKKSLSK